MNKITRTMVALVAGCIAFIYALGIVGSYDYASEVVRSMPEAAYYSILDTLGEDCTEKAIAEEYMSKREYYDSLIY